MTGKPTLRQAAIALGCCAMWSAAHAQAPHADINVLAGRDQLLAVYDRMPRAHMERMFMRCDTESSQSMLGLQEGVLCAMVWDALLKRGFDGDVQALLVWWRAQREAQQPASSAQPSPP